MCGLGQSGSGKSVKSGWILMCSIVESTGFLMDLQGERSKEVKVNTKVFSMNK